LNKIIVWGLKSVIDSYKFVQKSFYENAQFLGYQAIWVDDLETNQSLVNRGDIVFAVDRARRFLPIRKDVRYVLHNISGRDLNLDGNFINIQVFRKDSLGTGLGIPWVQWDESTRTLYQPWGIPVPPKLWKSPSSSQKRKEYWMGSIWNDSENRGNSEFMKKYIRALADHGITFSRKGTPTRFQPNGISEARGQKLVNKSIIGAAVVGEWQRENLYVPCRLLKNVASGVPPSSNGDFSLVFGQVGGIFESDPELLITRILSLTRSQREEIVFGAQEKLLPYTYTAGMNRIFNFLN
jgi:hypothetical protein